MVGGLVAFAVGARALLGNGTELITAGEILGRVSAPWVALAVAAEAASYVTYALAERSLLGAERSKISLGALAGLATAAQAIANVLPAGMAIGNIYVFSRLRRYGVSDPVNGWMLVITSLLYLAVLLVLALVGSQLAGDVLGLRTLFLGLLAGFVVVLVGAVVVRRRGLDRRTFRRAVHELHRALPALAERPVPGPPDPSMLRPATWTAASGWLMASWLTDCACLALAFTAIGATPPWQGLLLAYCAGQVAATLPITPGGLGVVEGSLTVALVAFGGAETTTLAAVLLYRLISYWAVLPVGGVAHLALRRPVREATP